MDHTQKVTTSCIIPAHSQINIFILYMNSRGLFDMRGNFFYHTIYLLYFQTLHRVDLDDKNMNKIGTTLCKSPARTRHMKNLAGNVFTLAPAQK